MVKIVKQGIYYRIHIDGIGYYWSTFVPSITNFILFSIQEDYFGAKEDIIRDFRSIL